MVLVAEILLTRNWRKFAYDLSQAGPVTAGVEPTIPDKSGTGTVRTGRKRAGGQLLVVQSGHLINAHLAGHFSSSPRNDGIDVLHTVYRKWGIRTTRKSSVYAGKRARFTDPREASRFAALLICAPLSPMGRSSNLTICVDEVRYAKDDGGLFVLHRATSPSRRMPAMISPR